MPTNENKKTAEDYQEAAAKKPNGPKVAQVTWFAVHEALMNPGLGTHITSFMQGNLNMNGRRKFEWIVGSPYITTVAESGDLVVIPIVNLKSFSVKL